MCVCVCVWGGGGGGGLGLDFWPPECNPTEGGGIANPRVRLPFMKNRFFEWLLSSRPMQRSDELSPHFALVQHGYDSYLFRQ